MANTTPVNCKPASSYISTSLKDPVKLRIQEGGRKPITVPQLLESTVNKIPNRPALAFEDNEKNWRSLTYSEYWTKARLIAKAFIKLGLEPRTSCGILAYSCPEWFLAQMATILAGGVSAGIYTTNSEEAVYYVLATSNATICVVDDTAQMAKVRSIRHRLPKLKAVIQINIADGDFSDNDEGYYSWPNIEAIGLSDPALEVELEERLRNVVANECMALIFTSGTVGMPKPVMLSHDSLLSASALLVDPSAKSEFGYEVLVSYLPLNHVAGQIFDFIQGMMLGACVYFADRNALKGTLNKTMIQAQPTKFVGVPRVFEKMQEKLIADELKMSWIFRFIHKYARTCIENFHLTVMEGSNKSLNSWTYWLATKITQKIRMNMGFERIKTILVGAAPFSVEQKKFFLSYDLKLIEIYGLSESSGPITGNWSFDNLNSTGKAVTDMKLKINNPDKNGIGEIFTLGRIVFMGYLNEPEQTKEVLEEDGWFHTGDLGRVDSKGYLFISGRLKEILITSGGENIPPARIERFVLQELPGLSNTMLVGDKRKFLTMLVTIKTDIDSSNGKPKDTLQPEALEWMTSLDLPYVTLSEILNAGPCPKVVKSIQEGIDRVNANALSNPQKVQKFAILPHDFSIPTGELGPTLKLRRNIVLEKNADLIECLYKGT